METTDKKSWMKSKTVWFNILSGLVAIAGTLATDKAIPENVTQLFAAVVTIGNVALRFISTDKITVK